MMSTLDIRCQREAVLEEYILAIAMATIIQVPHFDVP